MCRPHWPRPRLAARSVGTRGASASRQLDSTEAGPRRVGWEQRCGLPDLRGCTAIPNYPTETDAVRGFMHLVRYRDALRTADGDAAELAAGFQAGRRGRAGDRREGGSGRAHVARSDRVHAPAGGLFRSDRARVLARTPRRPRRRPPCWPGRSTVVVKILSPDIVHKSDVGGVRLNLTSEARGARRGRRHHRNERGLRDPTRASPASPSIRWSCGPKARELIAGIADDPTFGPVIVFGRGGTAVEVIGDKALALPPLDLELARDADRAHARVARAQGLPRRPCSGHRRRRAARSSSSRNSLPICRSCANSISTPSWPTRTASSPSMPE